MTLQQALLTAVQNLPNAISIRRKIIGKNIMSLSQRIIAALYSITNQEAYGFYFAYEPELIERIIEITELPFNEDSVKEVKSRLPGVMGALKEIGVEITHPCENYVTVWGPGVRRG
jgi:hypothetical protein